MVELNSMPKSVSPARSPATKSNTLKTASAAARMQRQGVLSAVRACEEKKASDITLLELEKGSSAFTDYFVICSGSNPRQMQAISDQVEQQLANSGLRPQHIEGYNQADWILLDYVDFVVHVFSESARKFYDLERLWKSARRVELGDLQKVLTRKAAKTTVSSSRRASARKPPAPARKKK